MKPKRAKATRKGFVLVLVLCMVVMLAAVLLVFNKSCRADLRVSNDLKNSEQALNVHWSGLNIAISAVRDNTDIYKNEKLLRLLSGEKVLISDNAWSSVYVTEENSKLNINLLIDKNGKPDRARIDQLLRLIDHLNQDNYDDSRIGYGIVPTIIDWIDSDDKVTALDFIKNEKLGAESAYYKQRVKPYPCKNAPLDTIEELLLIKGMSPSLFEHIGEYLTVHGNGSINVNCAPAAVITAMSEDIDRTMAQMIIDRRNTMAFKSIADLRDIPGMSDIMFNRLRQEATVAGADQFYSVRSLGNAGNLQCTIMAVLRKNDNTKKIEVVTYKELYNRTASKLI